jgi:hypothetical protein
VSHVDERLAALKSAIESEFLHLRDQADLNDRAYRNTRRDELAAIERANLAEAELSTFLSDIEALIPADCRNTRPDRLASVRAAVGMMAQKVANATPAPSVKDGPTEEQVTAWRLSCLDGPSAGFQLRLCTMAWQAAREGMVAKPDYNNSFERLVDIVDENFGRHPVMTPEELMTALDSELLDARTELGAVRKRVGELETRCEAAELQHKLWRELAEQHTGRSTDDHQRRAVSDMLDQRTAWESWCADMVYRNPESHRIPDEHQGRQMLTARLDDYYELNLMFPDRGEGEGPVPPIYAVAESLIGRLRSDLKHERAELERVKAEVAGWKEWSKPHGFDTIQADVARLRNNERELGELFREFRLGLNANDTMDSVFATIRGWRDAATAPASDEVTEAEARALSKEASDAATKVNSNPDSREWDREYTHTLIRLARRNHGGQPSSNPVQLPLSEAQREELAKVVQRLIVMPGDTAFNVVDAIAPRIARVGVELLSVPRERLLQLAITNNRSPDYTGGHARAAFNWEQFAADVLNEARAILAAAQGGAVVERDMKPENSRKSVSHFDRATHYLNGLSDGDSILVKRDRLIAEFADVEQRAIPQPPRGRKLTDGEQLRLSELIGAWSDRSNRNDLPEWYAIRSFVESLLAPQDEVRVARRDLTSDELATLANRYLSVKAGRTGVEWCGHGDFADAVLRKSGATDEVTTLFYDLWDMAAGLQYDKQQWVRMRRYLGVAERAEL